MVFNGTPQISVISLPPGFLSGDFPPVEPIITAGAQNINLILKIVKKFEKNACFFQNYLLLYSSACLGRNYDDL
jgi:hypothetical protein